MSKIEALDGSLSSQICAAQVIVDLSSALKELIENSLVRI